MWEYSKKVIENFMHPKNVGEIKNPDGEATVGSVVCGDFIKLSFKLRKKDNVIIAAKFKTFGCASAIASSSILTEMMKGKTIEDAIKITNKKIIKKLDGLPDKKIHCSIMCEEVLLAAIKNYKDKLNINNRCNKNKKEIICNCLNIDKNEIIKIIKKNKINTIEQLHKKTKAGKICGKCIHKIKKIIINTIK